MQDIHAVGRAPPPVPEEKPGEIEAALSEACAHALEQQNRGQYASKLRANLKNLGGVKKKSAQSRKCACVFDLFIYLDIIRTFNI